MPNFTDWTRKDFGDPYGPPPSRPIAEQETNQDLQKPIQQLICDVHEHAQTPGAPNEKMIWMTMRMVSMMGRVALEHERVGKRIVVLTWVLVWLTILLAVLTGFLIYLEFHHHP